MSVLKKANEKFRAGMYPEAIELWNIVIDESPFLAFTVKENISIAKRRLLLNKKTSYINKHNNKLHENDEFQYNEINVLSNSIGFIDNVSNEKIYGWASYDVSENKFPEISLYIDNKYIVTQKASIYRKDLKDAGFENARRGFLITVPKEFADGKDHLIEIRPGKNHRFARGKFIRKLPLRIKAERVVTLFKGIRNNALEYERLVPILFVAHNANGRLFGGELSFIDLVSLVDKRKYKIIVALPNPDKKYIERLKSYADVIVSTDKAWWDKNKSIQEQLVNDFQTIISKYMIKLVYVNTIMLREPLIAANREKIRSACHIREVINYDEALLNKIGKSEDIVIEKVKKRSEYIVANSKITKNVFNKPRGTFLIYNAVDVDKLNIELLKPQTRPFRVGMLSSNLFKKGIADFIELARATRTLLPEIEFNLIGPNTSHLENLKNELSHDKTPPNLKFLGYFDEPQEAIRSLHVVVNFSHFAESFGRTVAEAMAARRPVIAYNYGALPELIENNKTGFIIRYKNPLDAIEPLRCLISDKDLYNKIAESARARAVRLFSFDILKKNINCVINNILNANTVSDDGSLECEEEPTISVIIPNYNYSKYLSERITSVIRQSHSPNEIIFLDDGSKDDSVRIAEELLSGTDIEYKIIINEKNEGIYSQWIKGIKEASGTWVWIAEADDFSSKDFLSTLLLKANKDVSIVYCQSKRIDSDGKITAENNLQHTNELSETRWLNDYSAYGRDEIALGLCYRNVIPNVSAAIIRRSALLDVESEIKKYYSCGDWWLYTHILRHSRIEFVASSLNYFRRHPKSQTNRKKTTSNYLDEIAAIHSCISKSFRLLPMEVERFVQFVERDYKIEGYKNNQDHPAIKSTLSDSRLRAKYRKRFAFITTNNGSWNGGSEVLWKDAARRLIDQGHDVVVLTRLWAPRPPFEDEFRKKGIRFYYKQQDGFSQILTLKPDMFVISVGDQDEGVEYFSVLVDKKIPYIIVNQLTKDPRYWRLRDDLTHMLQIAYRSAKMVFFSSRNNLRLMEKRLGSKLKNSGIHFNPFHIDDSKPIPLPSIGIGYHLAVPARLLFIHKGQDLLIPIFSSKKWKSRNLFVDFYGEGPDRNELSQKANKFGIEQFKIHGRIDDIKNIWNNCHGILLPSRMEGMPIVLISAMVAGRVPIVTNIGGASEIVKDGYNGFIANNPVIEDIENALERAWKKRIKWEEFGLRARVSALSYLPKDPVGDFVQRVMKITKENDKL